MIMKIQFVFGNDLENVFDIDVAEAPTEEQANAIEQEIQKRMGDYEKEYGDFENFNYYECCYDAVMKYMHIAENRVVKTFYL